MSLKTLVGQGREAINIITDEGSFKENFIDNVEVCSQIGDCAVIGTAQMDGKPITIISNDAKARNPRFPVVYAGVIGMEEAYKMAKTVYTTIAVDKDKPIAEKRPIILLVDTPGNGPGKLEEIFGMNKATGAYQLALAEARQSGHAVIAMIIGRAISGAFLCHGLQADRILSLPKEFNTMIHVMPITSISRITKIDIEKLEELSASNPVFASGANFFYNLGGLEEVVESIDNIRPSIIKYINEVKILREEGKDDLTGPWGRGKIGEERKGRVTRANVINKMREEFAEIEDQYL